ncbi:MFS transporter [Verrucomicrobiota bacterium]|nr:protein spinster homolog 3 [Verrucomicrobiota bacterium]GDY17848.1 MFS transporter [Verrucomicrobiota bacterium]
MNFTPPAPPPSAGRTAWLMVALLLPVALLNYLDRQLVATMQKSIMGSVDDLKTQAQWGHLLAWFKWTYALASPFAGYVADRFGRRHVIALSLFVWSADTWATAHATSYDQLLATRAIMGLSEAFYIPAALALITDHHGTATRSRAVGLHQIGIYLGVMLGSLGGYVADDPALGWRWAFTGLGLLGVVYACPLWWYLRDTPRAQPAEAPRAFAAVGDLLGNRDFCLLLLYFTLPALAGWVVRDWMPSVLQKDLGLTQGMAGVSAVVWWQGAAIISALGGGWLADRWMRRSPRGRQQVSALGMSLIVPALLGVGIVIGQGSLPLAIAFLVLFGLGWGLFDSNNMPILAQIARPDQRATGYGLMNLASISCGGLADVGFGWLRDHQVPLNLIFGGFAAVACLSAWLVLKIRATDADPA